MKENYLTKAKAGEILQEASGVFNHPRVEFSLDSSALLVLDMQKFFAGSDSHAWVPSMEMIVPVIKILIGKFNQYNRPIIFTKHINTEANAALMASWWRDIIKEDAIIDELDTCGHILLEKSQYDAFYNTSLESILKGFDVNDVVITGVMTHLCCETTARSAFVRGFNSFFVVDGTATYNERFHRNSVYNLAHGFSVPIMAEDIFEL